MKNKDSCHAGGRGHDRDHDRGHTSAPVARSARAAC